VFEVDRVDKCHMVSTSILSKNESRQKCSIKYVRQNIVDKKCLINYFRQIVKSVIVTLVSNSTKMFDKIVVEQMDIFFVWQIFDVFRSDEDPLQRFPFLSLFTKISDSFSISADRLPSRPSQDFGFWLNLKKKYYNILEVRYGQPKHRPSIDYVMDINWRNVMIVC
jgi:hypothetical protein